MSLNPEWNITCRVCLQEGEIRSIFEVCPESNLSYCAKVMQCTSIEIRRNDSLPEQICDQCLDDLNIAYRFRVNCESSDAILQSYRDMASGKDENESLAPDMEDDSGSSSSEIQIPISSDVLYSYKPPSGLNVKLVSREQTVMLENNGEIIMCSPAAVELDDQVDVVSSRGGTSIVEAPEPLDEDDIDSLITYDDVLPPLSSRAGDEEEEDDIDDERAEARSELIDEELAGEGDSQAADSGKPDDSSTDIFFNTELVYVDKEDDILNQLAEIKREDDGDEWEVIYDDNENSDGYFQKLTQSKASGLASKDELGVSEAAPLQNTTASLKTIQSIRKANIPNEEKPTIENITIKPGPDGSMETVIRVKRNLKTAKQQHVCKLCNSSYKYKHALETHLRRHRGDKPYKCSECEKAFVVPFELRRHMRTHTGAKPYKCKFCERKFSDFGSKIKHERTHTGERPYVCEICEKSFTYSHVLNSHMLIHTGVKKYSCPDCGKRFAKSHHLKAHLNTHIRSSANNNTISKSNNDSKDILMAVDEALSSLDQHGSHVDHLMGDSMDNRSADFQLEDPETGGNPFGQLVNISDYMISTKNETASIGAIMDDCVIHDGGPDDDVVTDVDDDPMLNVVTVLASNQVAGLVEGDYGNIRIINGTVYKRSKIQSSTSRILPTPSYKTRLMTAYWSR